MAKIGTFRDKIETWKQIRTWWDGEWASIGGLKKKNGVGFIWWVLEKKAAAEGGEEGESLEDTLGKGTAGNLSLFSQSADFQLLSQSAFLSESDAQKMFIKQI